MSNEENVEITNKKEVSEETPKIKRVYKKAKKTKSRKKRGRKKKRGPKPKKTEPKKRGRKRLPYRLIMTVNNRKKSLIGRFTTEEDAYRMMYEMSKQNQEEVILPMQTAHYGGVMRDVKYNLFIIRKKTPDDMDRVTRLRNDYGEFINYETDHSRWLIVDKVDWFIEETFWVFGYHPHYQRKDFRWIFSNFLEKHATDKYMFKNVWIYRNKVIVECMEDLEIVFCKNQSDAIRLYNKLEEWSNKNKFKYVVFCGRIARGHQASKWIKRLCEWTGFNENKIKRNSLRP